MNTQDALKHVLSAIDPNPASHSLLAEALGQLYGGGHVAEPTVEPRVAALEKEVADLKTELEKFKSALDVHEPVTQPEHP